MKCPKCGYVRTGKEETDPSICPSCGIAYGKWSKEAEFAARARINELKHRKITSNPRQTASATDYSPENDWREIAAFRVLILPQLLQALFWVGSVAIVAAAFIKLKDAGIAAFLAAFFGLVVWRLLIELTILPFKIHETLETIRRSLENGSLPPQK